MKPDNAGSSELRGDPDRNEAEDIDRVATRLTEERLPLSDRFRDQLGARLTTLTKAGAIGPQRLGLAVAGYITAGLALIALAALGLTGFGPLGP